MSVSTSEKQKPNKKQEKGKARMVLFMSIFSWVTSLLVVYIAVKFWYMLWWRPRTLEKKLRHQGIHGNTYKFLRGDLNEQDRALKEAWSKPISLTHSIAPRALPYFHETREKYGRKSMFWNGATPRVIIWDPDMVKSILTNKSGNLIKPPLSPLFKNFSKGISSLEGEEWVSRRKKINPAFHLEKLKGMMPAFTKSCNDLIEKWKELFSSAGETCELDVWPEFQNLTGDVISRTAFGSNYEEGKKIFELQREEVVLVTEAARSLYLPGLRFLPAVGNSRMVSINKEISTILRDLIKKKELSMRMGESGSDDLLGLLLQSVENSNADLGERKTEKYKIKVDDVIDECKLFYFAGQATTSVLLTWTVIVLGMHLDWQEKAREEVMKVCGKKTPDFESLNQLKIVTVILNEVLRLYPPVTGIFRRTSKEMTSGDTVFPAGVELFLPFIFIHHEPEYWGEDAQEFNPERFSQGVANASKDQNVFFPFGWGPRICLGQNFAVLEAKTALVMILQHFSFELSPSYTHAPYTVLTLQPQFGAQVILRRIGA